MTGDVHIGRCLCGAVEIRAAQLPDSAWACHCENCRRWTGSVQFGLDVPSEYVTVTGPVATYRAVAFAERAFCSKCGTHLWLRDDDGGVYEFLPGLFDTAAERPVKHESYADRAFACAKLAGDHPRETAADYERDTPQVLEPCG